MSDNRAKAEAIARVHEGLSDSLSNLFHRGRLADAIEAALNEEREEANVYKQNEEAAVEQRDDAIRMWAEERQAREDAELLVWAFANNKIHTYKSDGLTHWELMVHIDTPNGHANHIALPNGPVPVLTNEAEAALRRMKEESG